MRHLVFAIATLTLLAGSTGCRMCAHPFDYCGPTFTGGCGEPCGCDVRAGSILSGGKVTTAEMSEAPLMPVPDQQSHTTPSGWHAPTNAHPTIQSAGAPVDTRQR